MHYFEQIRILREERHFSQAFVASYLHIGQSPYSDYELGKTRVPLDIALILANLYDVRMNYLCGISNHTEAYLKKRPARII